MLSPSCFLTESCLNETSRCCICNRFVHVGHGASSGITVRSSKHSEQIRFICGLQLSTDFKVICDADKHGRWDELFSAETFKANDENMLRFSQVTPEMETPPHPPQNVFWFLVKSSMSSEVAMSLQHFERVDFDFIDDDCGNEVELRSSDSSCNGARSVSHDNSLRLKSLMSSSSSKFTEKSSSMV